MATFNAAEHTFTSKDGKRFLRKQYGQENQAAYFVDEGDGFTFYAGTLAVQFNPARSRAELQSPLQHAWIRARHLSPSIASVQFKREKHYYYEYEVPTAVEAEQWAEKTIIWHDESKTIVEVDLALEDIWWRCDKREPTVQLHIFPSSQAKNELHIGYLAPHNCIDGRSLMKLMEHVLSWTLDELKNPTQETPKLDWGSETSRLPPTLVVAAELHGKPFPEGNPPPAPPPGFVPFLSPIIANKNIVPGQSNNVNALLVLTEAETAKYREACRKNSVTVTDLMLALIALAEVEMTLQLAIKNKDAAAAGPYEQATHFLIGFYFMNHRHKLSNYNELDNGALLFGTEGTSVLFDMAKLREAIQFDKSSQKIIRNTSREVVWTGVAEMVKAATKATPSDWEAVLKREVDRQWALEQGLHNNDAFHMRIPMMSSIGDYHSMDILNAFVPSASSPKEIEVTTQMHTIRVTHPLLVPICWQYAGKLNFSWSTSRKWADEESMELVKKLFKEWIDIYSSA